jgi:hypothetical protein
MDSLDPDVAQLLINIDQADGGAGHRFAPMFIPSNPAPIAVAPYVVDPHLLLGGPMRTLAERGLVTLGPAGASGDYGEFQITAEGRQAAAAALAERADGKASAEQQVVRHLVESLDKAIARTGDPAQQAALRQVRDGAEAADATVLSAAIKAAAQAA